MPRETEELSGDAERVYALVRTITAGRVMSYGQVADELGAPFTARNVGAIMAFAPRGVPWWRVVGARGDLLIRKRDPVMAIEQAKKLMSDGIELDEKGVTDIERFRFIPGLQKT